MEKPKLWRKSNQRAFADDHGDYNVWLPSSTIAFVDEEHFCPVRNSQFRERYHGIWTVKKEKKWLAQLAYFYGHLNGLCKQTAENMPSHWPLYVNGLSSIGWLGPQFLKFWKYENLRSPERMLERYLASLFAYKCMYT